MLTFAEHARAVLYNGLGRYDAALAPARRAQSSATSSRSAWTLLELVEAAARCGQADVARAALERLAERTRAAGTELGARDRGAVARPAERGRGAEGLYREAIERLGRTRLGARAGARSPLVRRVAAARPAADRRP